MPIGLLEYCQTTFELNKKNYNYRVRWSLWTGECDPCLLNYSAFSFQVATNGGTFWKSKVLHYCPKGRNWALGGTGNRKQTSDRTLRAQKLLNYQREWYSWSRDAYIWTSGFLRSHRRRPNGAECHVTAFACMAYFRFTTGVYFHLDGPTRRMSSTNGRQSTCELLAKVSDELGFALFV